MKSSSYLISLLSLIVVSISHSVCAQELYKALEEKNVPAALEVLERIRKRERDGLVRPMMLDAYRRGALGIVMQGLGIAGIGVGSGHAINRIRPIPQPVRPNPISANSTLSATVGGVGAAASLKIAAAYGLAEAVGTSLGVPTVGTYCLAAALGAFSGCKAADAVQSRSVTAQHSQAMAAYDQQVTQVQSHRKTRVNNGALVGTVGAIITLGPSLYRTVCNQPSVSSICKCCRYEHDGHNLWSIAFGMNDDQLITFSTKFLEYDPPRELMNKPMRNGMYPIHAAVQRGSYELVKLFIKNNVIKNNADDTFAPCYSLDQEDAEGKTALLYATEGGHREIAITLLTPHEETKLCADSNIPNRSGLAPLHIAVEQDRVDLIQLLVAEGARVQCRIPSTGLTPLHIAAQQGYEDCAEHLLRLDESDIEADHKNERDSSLVNMQDKEGNTPLLYAAQYGYYSVVQTLLDQQGTDPFLANQEGLTPLMAACRIGNKYIVSDLMQVVSSNKHKQFINQQDIHNRNALHHLIEGRSQKMHSIASTLYNIGIDIDDMTMELVENLGNSREDMLKALHITEFHSRDQ